MRQRKPPVVIPGAPSSGAPRSLPLGCSRVSVYARVRPAVALDGEYPLSERLLAQPEHSSVCVLPEGATVDVLESSHGAASVRSFPFSGVLAGSAQQAEAYRATTAASVREALSGSNAVVLVYGQSGAGKTHTVFGPSDHDPAAITARDAASLGLIPRAMHELFELIGLSEGSASASGGGSAAAVQYSVSASCCQLYNDVWVDLLAGAPNLDNSKATPERAVSEPAGSVRAILDILHRSARHKAIAATALNSHSSRGHTVFQARVQARPAGSSRGLVRTSTLTFVDLAGSERLSRMNHGPGTALLAETRSINSSLHALGAVLAAMAVSTLKRRQPGGDAWGESSGGGGSSSFSSSGGGSAAALASSSAAAAGGFIPWRDSKLTRFLQGCLAAEPAEALAPTLHPSTLSLIVCLSPVDSSLQESLSSCYFAARALAATEALAGNGAAVKALLKMGSGQVPPPSLGRPSPFPAAAAASQLGSSGGGSSDSSSWAGSGALALLPAAPTPASYVQELDAVVDRQRTQIGALTEVCEALKAAQASLEARCSAAEAEARAVRAEARELVSEGSEASRVENARARLLERLASRASAAVMAATLPAGAAAMAAAAAATAAGREAEEEEGAGEREEDIYGAMQAMDTASMASGLHAAGGGAGSTRGSSGSGTIAAAALDLSRCVQAAEEEIAAALAAGDEQSLRSVIDCIASSSAPAAAAAAASAPTSGLYSRGDIGGADSLDGSGERSVGEDFHSQQHLRHFVGLGLADLATQPLESFEQSGPLQQQQQQHLSIDGSDGVASFLPSRITPIPAPSSSQLPPTHSAPHSPPEALHSGASASSTAAATAAASAAAAAAAAAAASPSFTAASLAPVAHAAPPSATSALTAVQAALQRASSVVTLLATRKPVQPSNKSTYSVASFGAGEALTSAALALPAPLQALPRPLPLPFQGTTQQDLRSSLAAAAEEDARRAEAEMDSAISATRAILAQTLRNVSTVLQPPAAAAAAVSAAEAATPAVTGSAASSPGMPAAAAAAAAEAEPPPPITSVSPVSVDSLSASPVREVPTLAALEALPHISMAAPSPTRSPALLLITQLQAATSTLPLKAATSTSALPLKAASTQPTQPRLSAQPQQPILSASEQLAAPKAQGTLSSHTRTTQLIREAHERARAILADVKLRASSAAAAGSAAGTAAAPVFASSVTRGAFAPAPLRAAPLFETPSGTQAFLHGGAATAAAAAAAAAAAEQKLVESRLSTPSPLPEEEAEAPPTLPPHALLPAPTAAAASSPTLPALFATPPLAGSSAAARLPAAPQPPTSVPAARKLGLEPQLAPAQQQMPGKLSKTLPSRSAVKAPPASTGGWPAPSEAAAAAAAAAEEAGASAAQPAEPEDAEEESVTVYHPDLGGFVSVSRGHLMSLGVTIDSQHQGIYLPH